MKPILFNTEMVRAILEGRKTVTRRVVKLPKRVQKQENGLYTLFTEGTVYENFCIEQIVDYISPYQVGDILYVRETWIPKESEENGKLVKGFAYKADFTGYESMFAWRPSIHMPKEAARIFLRVTDVRVERLQDITDEQAEAEGFNDYTSTALGFPVTWDNTIKPDQFERYGWHANPYVWVIEFERVEKPAAD